MGGLACQSGTSDLVLSYRPSSTFSTISRQPPLVLSITAASTIGGASCMVITGHIARERPAISLFRTSPSLLGHHPTIGTRESSANRPVRSAGVYRQCLALCELLRTEWLFVGLGGISDHTCTYIWENSPHHLYCDGVVNSTHACAVQRELRLRRRMSRKVWRGKGRRC
jgi:hypothetical protein